MKRIFVIIVLIVAGFAAFYFSTQSDPPDPVEQTRTTDNEIADSGDDAATNIPDDVSSTVTEEISSECLTVDDVLDLSGLLEDMGRLESISAEGEVAESYRGIDRSTVEAYAGQGDSLAMVVFGAMFVMDAFGKDDSAAVDWLTGSEFIPDLYQAQESVSADMALKLNDAAYWFYEAALNGRLMALQNYGLVRGRVFGGPVGLGWISQQEFEGLNQRERMSLIPSNLYGRVAYDIAPQLNNGLVGEIAEMLPASDIQANIRQELVIEFHESLSAAGLSTPDIAPASTMSSAELRERLCDSEWAEIERRRALEVDP